MSDPIADPAAEQQNVTGDEDVATGAAVTPNDGDTSPVVHDAQPQGLTGDGALNDDLDDEKVDVVEPVSQAAESTHPEPVAHAYVRQDNVTEPGVQTTHAPTHDEHGNVEVTSSSHSSEPVAVDVDVVDADVTDEP